MGILLLIVAVAVGAGGVWFLVAGPAQADAADARRERDQSNKGWQATHDTYTATEQARVQLAGEVQTLGSEKRTLEQRLAKVEADARAAHDAFDTERDEWDAERDGYQTTVQDTLRGDHDGPVITCDRFNKVLTVSFPRMLGFDDERELSEIRRIIREQNGADTARVEWDVARQAWNVENIGHVRCLVQGLPALHGPTLFIHVVGGDEKCASRCQKASWDKSPCECDCGGAHHGSGGDHDLEGWRRVGWRLLRDTWCEYRFILTIP